MIEIADETILMVDSSKFGTRAFSQIVPVSDIDCIITDSNIDEETRYELEETKIKLVIVN